MGIVKSGKQWLSLREKCPMGWLQETFLGVLIEKKIVSEKVEQRSIGLTSFDIWGG